MFLLQSKQERNGTIRSLFVFTPAIDLYDAGLTSSIISSMALWFLRFTTAGIGELKEAEVKKSFDNVSGVAYVLKHFSMQANDASPMKILRNRSQITCSTTIFMTNRMPLCAI